jgi:hypothetical protein
LEIDEDHHPTTLTITFIVTLYQRENASLGNSKCGCTFKGDLIIISYYHLHMYVCMSLLITYLQFRKLHSCKFKGHSQYAYYCKNVVFILTIWETPQNENSMWIHSNYMKESVLNMFIVWIFPNLAKYWYGWWALQQHHKIAQKKEKKNHWWDCS